MKFQQRQQQAEYPDEADADLSGVLVAIKDLEDIVVKDAGGAMATAGRCPLVIDTSQRASVFFQCVAVCPLLSQGSLVSHQWWHLLPAPGTSRETHCLAGGVYVG